MRRARLALNFWGTGGGIFVFCLQAGLSSGRGGGTGRGLVVAVVIAVAVDTANAIAGLTHSLIW